MKYTIKSSFITNLTAEIEADDYDHAYKLASLLVNNTSENAVSLKYKTIGTESIKIKEIVLSDLNFTDEQLAFIKSYSTNVAVAEDEIIKAFVLSENHDEFYKDHSDTYSGLADARGVWEDARRYFKGAK
tara:strand:+ start:128 stop:517 length:390 start_codon:yes stop_codon:yes gene_type:complete